MSLKRDQPPDDRDDPAPDADAGTTAKPDGEDTDRPAPGRAADAARPALGGSGAPPTAATVPTTAFRLLSTMPPGLDDPADAAEPAAGGTGRVVAGEVADTAETADSGAGRPASAETADSGAGRPASGETAERAPSDDAAGTAKPGADGTGRAAPDGTDTTATTADSGTSTPLADSSDTAKLRTGNAGRAPSDDAADTAKLRTAGDAAAAAGLTGGGARRPPSGAAAGPSRHATGRLDGPLIPDAAGLRASWHRVQASFVDDPRGAVSDAADLVDHAAQALIGALRLRQNRLRGMWETTGVEGRGRGLLSDGSRIPFLGRGRRGDSAWDDDGGNYPAASGLARNGGRPPTRERRGTADADPAGAPAAEPGGVPHADENGGTAGEPIPDGTEQLRLVMQRYRSLFNQICRP